jgi:hypothetical protein
MDIQDITYFITKHLQINVIVELLRRMYLTQKCLSF